MAYIVDELLFIENKYGKLGAFNKDLEVVIPFEYEFINEEKFEDNKNAYYEALKGRNYGLINVSDSSFHILSNKKDVDFDLYKSLIKEKDGKLGIVNIQGEFVIEPDYDVIVPWTHNKQGNYRNQEKLPNLYLICKNRKIGIASTKEVLVEPIYDNCYEEDFDFANDLYPAFVMQKDGYDGYVDKYGKALSDFTYVSVQYPLTSPIAEVYDKNNIQQFINIETGKVIYTNNKEKPNFFNVSHNHLSIFDGRIYRVYDFKGNIIAEFLNNKELKSADIRYLNEKLLAYYKVSECIKDGIPVYTVKVGLLTYSGKVLTDMKYQDIQAISNTTTVLCSCMVGRLFELVDENANILMSKMACAGSCVSNLDDEGKILPPIMYFDINDETMQTMYTISPPFTSCDEALDFELENQSECFEIKNGEYSYVIKNDTIFVIDKNENEHRKINFVSNPSLDLV